MYSKTKKIEKILKQFPDKDRFRFFFLFVLLSFTFWISTKLSNNYQIEQTFKIVWSDIPKNIILSNNQSKVDLSITASGIEILWYRLFKNKIIISLKETNFSSQPAQVLLEKKQYVFQQQLFLKTQLNQIKTDVIFLEFSLLNSRKIIIVPQTSIKYRPGYLSDSSLRVIPDSIWVTGPQSILDTLSKISTLSFVSNDTTVDIREKLILEVKEGLQYEINQIQIEMPISRYSEKEFTINLETINLPNKVRMKFFPPKVKLRVTMPLILLNGIKETDFGLAVDYGLIKKNPSKKPLILLTKKPPKTKNIVWEPKFVNYLIRK
jgi:hypothetical protein